MNFFLREGVSYLSICGAHLLVPSRIASEACKGILTLNFVEAVVWTQMDKGKSPDDVAGTLSLLFRKSADEIAPMIRASLDKLCKYGFLIPVEDEHGSD